MTLLGFPTSNPLPIRGEMFIDGAWVNVTSDVRLDAEVVISARGRANEQGRPSPCTCDFTLNDRTGKYNNRNPLSPYYGLLPPYIPVRFSVTEDRSFALFDESDGCEIKTTDKAVLDITDEIDIRVEFELARSLDGVDGHCLAAKRASGGQASWLFIVKKDGSLQFIRSVDGSAFLGVTSTTVLPQLYSPQAVRVTWDGNDGAGNRVTKFYTSDTISGSWTQLGSTITTVGTSSIFSSTAPLELGRHNNGDNLGISELTGMRGRIYGFELYQGIASPTLVAKADIYNQARGTTSFSDGLGTPNTWTVEGTCEITPDNRRFSGELAASPIEWDVSGNDIMDRVQAADVTRRLGKGSTPVVSPLTDFFTSISNTGLWPCEDGTAATTMENKHTNGVRGQFVDVQFGTPSDLPATAGSVTVNSTSTVIKLTPDTSVANTGYAYANWTMKMASLPGSSVTMFNLNLTGGTIGRINFSVTATTYDIAAYDTSGTLITSSASTHTGNGSAPTDWNFFRIQLTQSGGNVDLDLGWYSPGNSVLIGITTLTFAGTAGRFRAWNAVGATNNIGTQYTHFVTGQIFLDNGTTDYLQAANAFAGETTAARWLRIGLNNGIDTRVVGTDDSSESMGSQPRDTPLNILMECVETEQGQYYPDRDTGAMVMRTYRSLINQTGPSIDYSLNELGPTVPRPVPDDGLLRNTVTASRADGSTGFHQHTDGPKGSDNAGVIPASINRNPYLNARLDDLAGWDSFLGTWDEERWTQVMVELARTNYVGTATKVRKGHILAALDIGHYFLIVNPPSHLPTDDIRLMMQGLQSEVLGNRTWRITWNTSPYGPYVVALFDTARYDSGSTTTNAAYDDNDTSIVFSTTDIGDIWSTTSEPYEVVISGETIQVDSMGAASGTGPYVQTATVTRGIGGFSKALPSGSTITLTEEQAGRYGL
jgi:hypothetical protein